MKQYGKIALLSLCGIFVRNYVVDAQMVLTMEQALEYSVEHNPDLRSSKLSMERYEYNLIAQKASLKSKFALNLDPFSYSQERRFDERFSEWYTSKSLSSAGTFSISQPIIWTDATVSLNNRLSWQNSESTGLGGAVNSNRTYSN